MPVFKTTKHVKSDFVREFETVYVCRLFRTVDDPIRRGPWNKKSAGGSWRKASGTAGGFKAAASSPQFRLRSARPAEFFLSLTLDVDLEKAASSAPFSAADTAAAPVYIALYVLPCEGGAKAKSIARACADSGPFTNLPMVSCSVMPCRHREEGFAVLPTTYGEDMESSWTITVFADVPFTFEPL